MVQCHCKRELLVVATLVKMHRSSVGKKARTYVKADNNGSYESNPIQHTTHHKSTTKETNNNEKKSTKDEDDGSVPILAPPCTQLERQEGHHIAFGIIDLVTTTTDLKGLVSTDLPGRFPFTSSKGNNYIMCMYDYDSNVIWSHPIKFLENPDLIIGINACYKVLDKANFTPIIH